MPARGAGRKGEERVGLGRGGDPDRYEDHKGGNGTMTGRAAPADRAACAERLLRHLRNEGGRIGFGAWMAFALYDPVCGYYFRPGVKIGRAGDFYTASAVGDVYGAFWARDFARRFEAWREAGAGGEGFLAIVELGAGDGRFAAQVLDRLAAERPEVYGRLRYVAVEASPWHREGLFLRTKPHRPLLQLVPTPEALLSGDVLAGAGPVIVFANEFYDAFPVERLKKAPDGRLFWQVVREEAGRPVLAWADDVPAEARAYAERFGGAFSPEHVFEAPLEGLRLYRRLAEAFPGATFITVDYGLPFAELAAPHRREGTVVGFWRHRLRDDWFERPGEMDLTAQVPVEAYRSEGEAAGLATEALLPQGEYLVVRGILDFLQPAVGTPAERDPFHPIARRNRAVRALILPDGFGQAFFVLVQRRP
ncbi:MAG: hypothetical protein HSCHL_1815 [Hydrogenibacillus schlegelii]|uniref:SAM-dependent methyltransferase n=2 Tax=Hydrogenibacillus schlegelii TaxID=1484 RepID=A0A2T5GFA9_HYDSH|nr:MAG: hypothetical protein HSCHL_1815 [Hydrogenibacillus schlegelii]